MKKLEKILIAIGLTLTIAQTGSSSGFGKCPNYPSMPKFNVTKVSLNNLNYGSINLFISILFLQFVQFNVKFSQLIYKMGRFLHIKFTIFGVNV